MGPDSVMDAVGVVVTLEKAVEDRGLDLVSLKSRKKVNKCTVSHMFSPMVMKLRKYNANVLFS